MEVAGIMNHLPYLIIGGFCDYAKSHQSNELQGYATVTATYAKDLLYQTIPQRVDAAQKARFILNGKA